MTIKVYISGICGSQEVRKHQQRVLFILQTMPIDLKVIDVTEPGRDEDLVFMQEEAKKHDKKTQLPPQIFNDNEYCGDYADFQLANDDDEIMRFLKLETGPSKADMANAEPSGDVITQNGIGSHENGEENKDEELKNEVELNSDESKVVEDEKPTDNSERVPEAVPENEVQVNADVSNEKKAEESSEKEEESEEEESE